MNIKYEKKKILIIGIICFLFLLPLIIFKVIDLSKSNEVEKKKFSIPTSEVKTLKEKVVGASGIKNSNGIYYYNGTNVNNNLLFAGKCWQIVRTTDNDGVKIIYNGEPVNGTCTTTTNYIDAGEVAYNNDANKITSVGYIYGDYDYSSINFYTDSQAASFFGGGTGMTYIYGEDAILNSDGTYTLKNAKSFTASSDFLMGNTHKYTCFAVDTNKEYRGTTDYQCGNVVYITAYSFVSTSSGTAYYVSLPNTVSYYQSEYPALLHGFSSSGVGLNTNYTATWAFSTDATYDSSNNTYSLSGTVSEYDMGKWSTDHSLIDNSHFTCLRIKGTSCSSLYYVIYSGEGGLYFFKITGEADLTKYKNGSYLETILQDNSKNSNVKAIVDDWYVDNIISSNYVNYVIDDNYYNDRTISNYGGWLSTNETSSLAIFQSYDRTSFNLTLNDSYDLFKVASNQAKLTYPVGLLSYDEALMAGATTSSTSYLGANNFWLSTPYSFIETKTDDGTGEGTYFYEMKASVYSISNTGVLSSSYVDSTNYVRPVISVSDDIPVAGTGTEEDPYRLVYKVEYLIDGEGPNVTLPEVAYYEVGETVTVDTTFSSGFQVDGYSFNGWNKSGTFTMTTEDVNITGTWTKMSYFAPKIEVYLSHSSNVPVDDPISFSVIVTNTADFPIKDVIVDVSLETAINVDPSFYNYCSYDDEIICEEIDDDTIRIVELDANTSYSFYGLGYDVFYDDMLYKYSPGIVTVTANIVSATSDTALLAPGTYLDTAVASSIAILNICNVASNVGNGTVNHYRIKGSNNSSYSFVINDNECIPVGLETGVEYELYQLEKQEHVLDKIEGFINSNYAKFTLEPKLYNITYYNTYIPKGFFHTWDRVENVLEMSW